MPLETIEPNLVLRLFQHRYGYTFALQTRTLFCSLSFWCSESMKSPQKRLSSIREKTENLDTNTFTLVTFGRVKTR